MKWHGSALSSVIVGLALASCSKPPNQVRPSVPPPSLQNETSDTEDQGTISWVRPNKVTVGNPFFLVLRLEPKAGCDSSASSSGKQLAEVLVRMELDSQVEYAPPQLKVRPCTQQFVRVTVKEKGVGLAGLTAYAEGYDNLDTSVDVGFDGKVRVTSNAPLAYNEPGTLNVEVVSQDDKPLSFNSPVDISLQSVDAQLLGTDGQWSNSTTLQLKAGARSSPQFQIKSEKLTGGTIHLSASLVVPVNVIVSQENHQFEVAPVWWLPVLLAMFGALLYSVYSILSDDKNEKMLQKLFASILAGAIAWLFTGFDLLGLKLDTSSLRTYAITGFLFAFLGVDVLLSKKFPRTIHTPKNP
jgi:hypothetical protein